MTATNPHLDVVAVGEVMGLLDPANDGPLEDAGQFTLRIAGAEANALIALSRLGHRTSLVSAVGDDPVGRLVLRTLAEQGVRTDHVRISGEHPTGVFFKERFPDGLRRVYYYRRDSAAAKLRPVDACLTDLGAPRLLLASGLSLGLGVPEGLGAVARLAITRFAGGGIPVVFDANVRHGLWDGKQAVRDFAELRSSIDILLAGEDELAVLLPGVAPEAAAAALCREGMRAVVLKRGAGGAVVHHAGSCEFIAPLPVDRVVDSVGAGDAFAAGLISGLLHDWPVPDSARLGAVLGARAVTVSGDWEAIPEGYSSQALLAEYSTSVGFSDDRPSPVWNREGVEAQ
jgi:2-dehydro-3-deoxygluconokinase